ncbi:subtilisin-like protein [Lactarius hatsudake]|nr:subtilisin-like protein [Lactarius hatsudake]
MRYHCIFVRGFTEHISPPWEDMHIKHSWSAVPKNWENLGRPPSGTTIDLYITLKPQRENSVVEALYEVSEPGHPRYRAYLTKEQVADLVAPRPETLELVNSWLEHHGISSSSISMTHGGNTLMLKAVSVTQADTLLGASYQLYRHVKRGETIVRTVGYSLPVALHWHVLTGSEAVKSTSGEPATMLSSRAKVNPVTVSFLRRLYETEAYTPNTRGVNVLGVVGFLGDYPSPTDLTAFMRTYRSEAEDATFTVVNVNGGGYDPTKPRSEANLDIQYAEAMAYPSPHIFYSTGRGPSGMDDCISYSTEERLMSREYAMNVCDQFAKLGVRGVSVLVSSGNDAGTCMRDDGTVRFDSDFPGTCPHVTVVGGTTDFEPEVAASFSGGGFSDYFKRPTYQEEAVASGRGIPDIAGAQAIGLPIFFNDNKKTVSGTSAAAPLTANIRIVAGIISLLNDWLISTGQDPLGFLNHWLYGKGSRGLTDITEGSNPGCMLQGFSAIAGWDPVRSRLDTSSLSTLDDPGLCGSRVLERLSSAKC